MIKEIKNNQPTDTLRIEYMPGNFCNHKCHYCFPGSNEGDYPWPDVIQVIDNFEHLLTHYKLHGKTKSDIFIVGGEPTVWKELPILCKFLKDNFGSTIEISSNGSRSLEWWKENARYFDHVGISVHREFAKLDHIIEVCNILYENNVLVSADVLMDPDAYEQCVDIVEYLKKFAAHKWPIIAKVVHFNGLHRYTDQQLEYFDESIKQYPPLDWYHSVSHKERREVTITYDNNEVVTTNSDSWLTRNNLNYFKDWECNIGVDFIKIFPNGNITGNCQQTLYNDSTIHNFNHVDFRKTFMPTIGPVICTKQVCGCNEETVCNKRKQYV